MVRQDGKRNYVVQEGDEEGGVFSGDYPRQAALKAARRLDPARSENEAPRSELRLRERGTDKVHIYDAWVWEEDAPSDGPEWLSGRISQANVSKKGIDHQDS